MEVVQLEVKKEKREIKDQRKEEMGIDGLAFLPLLDTVSLLLSFFFLVSPRDSKTLY